MARRFRIGLIALAALVCALGAAAWWAAQSETALAWITARLEGFSGGRLRIESPRGSLIGTIGAARVVYADPDVRVTATEVVLDPTCRTAARAARGELAWRRRSASDPADAVDRAGFDQCRCRSDRSLRRPAVTSSTAATRRSSATFRRLPRRAGRHRELARARRGAARAGSRRSGEKPFRSKAARFVRDAP
jgi:hypothetical protein